MWRESSCVKTQSDIKHEKSSNVKGNLENTGSAFYFYTNKRMCMCSWWNDIHTVAAWDTWVNNVTCWAEISSALLICYQHIIRLWCVCGEKEREINRLPAGERENYMLDEGVRQTQSRTVERQSHIFFSFIGGFMHGAVRTAAGVCHASPASTTTNKTHTDA